MAHPRYNVEIVWRYAEGHRQTTVHSTMVRSRDNESAEAWGVQSLMRKLNVTADDIEIVKTNSQWESE